MTPIHADAPRIADRLVHGFETRFGPRERLVARATAALGVHVGPGTWAIFCQVEQPTAGGGRNSATTPTL